MNLWRPGLPAPQVFSIFASSSEKGGKGMQQLTFRKRWVLEQLYGGPGSLTWKKGMERPKSQTKVLSHTGLSRVCQNPGLL